MKLDTRRVAVVLCSVAIAAISTAVQAKPVKRVHRQAAPIAISSGAEQDPRYAMVRQQAAAAQAAEAPRGRRGRRVVQQDTDVPGTSPAFGGLTSNALVSEARRHLGTNPTGRSSLWCGAFMDMVLKRTGHAGGGNLASAYARYGTRVSGPQVGAIAVMGRKGGGHVGVVTGVDANGNPIIVSGNHNRTVAESVYPRGRIYAYVMPGN